ncbi:MAG: transglycosylase SLT domain-containing protein [Thermodesulfobacteriota bacterium]|nr:transglycosylase SLT domain-containing protein [Thermodesulfobacteriota bacterium]
MKTFRHPRFFFVITCFIFTAISLAFSGQTIAQETGGDIEIDAAADEFEKYQKAIEDQYSAYETDIEQEYEKYRQIIEEEYKACERKILRTWVIAEMSTEKKWVEYSSDYQSRQIVDFEEGYIQLDIITEAEIERRIDEVLRQRLRDAITEDQNTAFQRDPVAQNVENRLKDTTSDLKTGQVGDRPVLLKAITGKADPTDQEIDEAVARLKEQARITRSDDTAKTGSVVSLRVSLPPNTLQQKAMEYKPYVDAYAAERGLNRSLVFAIMHTESAFNPMARSPVPAYGLMQIVPRSAGKDATKLLYGQQTLLSPSYLYTEQNNINIGTAYLYLLYNRYLKAIKNPTSRIYCTIAAYNTGAGNVARAFTGTSNINRAARVINQMSPTDVYYHLQRNLPYQETRDYLERVTKRMAMYRSMQ